MKVLALEKVYYDDIGGILEYKWAQLGLLFFGISFVLIMLFSNVSYSSLYLLISVLIGVSIYGLYYYKKNEHS